MIRRVFFLPAKQQEFLAFSFAALNFFASFFVQAKKEEDKKTARISFKMKILQSHNGLELGLAIGTLFFREQTLQLFKMTMNDETSFLGYIVGWFSLAVTLICNLALIQVVQRKPNYAPICYILGFWWIGIGIGIYTAFKRPDNLLMDSLKGLLIVIFTYTSKKSESLSNHV